MNFYKDFKFKFMKLHILCKKKTSYGIHEIYNHLKQIGFKLLLLRIFFFLIILRIKYN